MAHTIPGHFFLSERRKTPVNGERRARMEFVSSRAQAPPPDNIFRLTKKRRSSLPTLSEFILTLPLLEALSSQGRICHRGRCRVRNWRVLQNQGLTIKTLRFYHEKEILVPAGVDPETGYRYYDARQIDKARIIAQLRG